MDLTQLLHDIMSDPQKYALYALTAMGALLAIVKALHVLVAALDLVAKMTPGKSDDNALRAVDAWLLKAESGLIWLQQKLLMLRPPKAAARLSLPPPK